MRGASRLCRERPNNFLAPREGSALSNLLHNDQMRRGSRRAGREAKVPPHYAVDNGRAAGDKAPARNCLIVVRMYIQLTASRYSRQL